jgi:hypothetical protein
VSVERQKSQRRQPLLGNGPANTHLASQSLFVIVATDTHETTGQLWEEVFCVRSVSRLYTGGQLLLHVSWQSRVLRRQLVWDGHQPARTWVRKQKGTSADGKLYQAEHWWSSLKTLFIVWQRSAKVVTSCVSDSPTNGVMNQKTSSTTTQSRVNTKSISA